MRRAGLSLAPLTLLLAGCGSANGPDDNASLADASAQLRAMQRQQPGEWRMTTRITAMDSAGVPAGSPVARLMREQLGDTQVTDTCVTDHQRDRPVFAQAVDPTHQCRYRHFDVRDGHVDALLECPAADGSGTVTVRHVGSFAPTRFDVSATMVRTDADGGGEGSLTMRIDGERLGDCKA